MFLPNILETKKSIGVVGEEEDIEFIKENVKMQYIDYNKYNENCKYYWGTW